MKTRSTSTLVCVLAMMLVMYNCKKKDEPFPTEPDSAILGELNATTMASVTLTTPKAVTSTPSSLEMSAKASAVAGDMGQLKSGTVPASVQAASDELNAALPAADVAMLSGVSSATFATVAAGGALPADLKAIMDKSAANPALQAYLPKVTLPTVDGVAVSGRSGAIEAVEGIEGVMVEDACVQAAAAAFETVKTKLDAFKATEVAKVTSAFSAAIAPLAAEEASCTSGLPAKYTALRTVAQAQATQALADLEAAKDVIPAGLYPVLKAFVNIQLLAVMSSLNILQAADLKACSAITVAKTAAITAARDADLSSVDASYATAIAAAKAKSTELVQSCHNQGGGK